ncbi:hypothetical protein [Flagellimonas pacifica]|uniref:Uncharacterized protein n=1 Tax=Flagellimonas pacifica TaxID=1247520 RepID=A0A285MXZ0_9FLAO|nr:hypothetical protein [Allomuricauda parva]SNZ02090.1 hypothetical protein SAMN06265377_3949 [Allomuricauda parva]
MGKDKKTSLEDWIEEGIKEVGLESPSDDFTHQILSKLPKKEIQSPQIVYRPLITKRGWALVVCSVIVVFALSFYSGRDRVNEEETILNKVFDSISIDFFSGIHFSDTVVIGSVLLAIFSCIQIMTLKRFMERQL